MAKSFLTESEIEEGLRGFRPSGEWFSKNETTPIPFFQWIEDRLLNRFIGQEEWSSIQVVALGSWARKELCPKSDIDVLLLGDEKKIFSFVSKLTGDGIKLRYRCPANRQDWTEGVKPFDILAILQARALSSSANEELEVQKKLIRSRGVKFLRSLMKEMVDERKCRNRRYDSITNYLEPNLKYGPGGLRDLQQAMYVFELFFQNDKNQNSEEIKTSLQVFKNYRQFFLTLRQRLHLMGSGDSVTAGDQNELAFWFGYDNVKNFMREIQLGLNRVNFYADWMVERARTTKKRLHQIEQIFPVKNIHECFSILEKDSSQLVQAKVRSIVENKKSQNRLDVLEEISRCLTKYFHVQQQEIFFIALFRSHLIELCVPEMERVSGLVQHDQYHRFTVDAHLQQTVRVLRRVYLRPKILGELKDLVNELQEEDWKILLWTALYHDLAKGLGGDHSQKGSQLVKRDFTLWKFSSRLTEETAWMVERHLDVSNAAFRMNPHAPSTWKNLYEKGVKGQRLKRLIVFTAIDIIATNPDAWSEWKERLLKEFWRAMTSPQAGKFVQLLDSAEKAKVSIDEEFIHCLDPFLSEQIPNKYFIQDFKKLYKNKTKDLPLFIWKYKNDEYWIRFHAHKDRPGLFLEWTKKLFASGCQVLQAFVQTYEDFGAYDWFHVKSSRSIVQLRKWIELADFKGVHVPTLKFDRVKVIEKNEEEAVLSFRGKDYPGLLVKAAHTIAESGCNIRWAKALTWGRQVDDVFSIQMCPDFDLIINKIKERAT